MMKLHTHLACYLGDSARFVSQHLLKRSGENIPGMVGLKLDPTLLKTLAQELHSSVVVTGTNGKTTTTGLIADLLASQYETVTCNRAGNNMTPGITAALMQTRTDRNVRAALECDELYTAKVFPQLQPSYLVLLNLFRDQLDRYGEIEHTQATLIKALESSPDTVTLVNADDPLCAHVALSAHNDYLAFGLEEAPETPHTDQLSDSRFCPHCAHELSYTLKQYGHLGSYHCAHCGWKRPELDFAVTHIQLTSAGHSFDLEDRRKDETQVHHLTTAHKGRYMLYNLTAACSAALLMGVPAEHLQAVCDAYQPTSGRMQRFELGQTTLLANLAKNPAGFNQMLAQALADTPDTLILLVNDKDGDGNDISWLWDVAFEQLTQSTSLQRIYVGGLRGAELALRLKYTELAIPVETFDNLDTILENLTQDKYPHNVHLIGNYTAMPPAVAALQRCAERHPAAPASQEAYQSTNVSHYVDHQTSEQSVPTSSLSAADLEHLSERPLTLVHLYPEVLNLYGDSGNVAAIRKRCEWRGIPVKVKQVALGEDPQFDTADIVLLGGGSDREQQLVAKELQRIAPQFTAYVQNHGVLLAICGGYQLLGHTYEQPDNVLEGLSIIDMITRGKPGRIVGNVAVYSPEFKEPLVGFENHAGRTVLSEGVQSLGQTARISSGNNDQDLTEGARIRNVIGTYLHGPLLPKNPELADWLIVQALKRHLSHEITLAPLDDQVEQAARTVALTLCKQ